MDNEKDIACRMEFQGDNVALAPGGIFGRGDQWIIPVETRQVKICIRSISYLGGDAKTWENPNIRDWFQAEKDACQ